MLFPDIVGSAREPLPLFTTSQQRMGENHSVRYGKSLRPRWGFALGWDLLDAPGSSLVDAHVNAVSGAAVVFDWFDWSPLHWLYVPVGIGTGATPTFEVPGKNLDHDSVEFFAGATPLVVSSYPTGLDPLFYGRESVTFTTTPASGVQVWMNGRLRRMFAMRFQADDQPLTRDLDTGYHSFATRLVEEKPTP